MEATVIGGILIVAIIIILILSWALKADAKDAKARSYPPDGSKERLVWQAAHGNAWAQHILQLMEGTDHLFAIVEGYKEVIADARIEITKENPAHIKLNDAHDELHKWIVRKY
jgi:hypothetical protein